MNIVVLTLLLLNLKTKRALDIRQISLYNMGQLMAPRLVNLPVLQPPPLQKQCYVNNILTACRLVSNEYLNTVAINTHEMINKQKPKNGFGKTSRNELLLERTVNQNPISSSKMLLMPGNHGGTGLIENSGVVKSNSLHKTSNKINMKLDSSVLNYNNKPIQRSSSLTLPPQWTLPTTSPQISEVNTEGYALNVTTEKTAQEKPILDKFAESLDNFERKFLGVTFSKLTSISAMSRRENGMSYVQSGIFLQLALAALSMEVDPESKREIDQCIGWPVSDQERIQIINETVMSLPAPNDGLKFRWSTRLVLRMNESVGEQFKTLAIPALRLKIDSFNVTESPTELAETLNHMVEEDSGGAIHDTFDQEDLSEGVRAILVTTLYLRARWRAAPTLLNGTRAFRDDMDSPYRTVRMIRINDIMRYADLTDWDAEALEISYSTPGLSLLLLVPRGNSLRRLVDCAVNTSLTTITQRMQTLRVAATLPLYTLRMTLLLPNKLEAMGISKLVNTKNDSQRDSFWLSHAVQRIMFWAEAGRNAFKDDGLEWDEDPQRELVVDRPYIFYVRWRNKTLMNGNFVL